MPTISGRSPIGIGGSIQNVLTGSQYELAPFDGTIEIGCCADKNLVSCAIFSGPDVLQEPGGFVPLRAVDVAPAYPDDYHWEDEVASGDRLKLSFLNGNAAAVTVMWACRITPA